MYQKANKFTKALTRAKLEIVQGITTVKLIYC